MVAVRPDKSKELLAAITPRSVVQNKLYANVAVCDGSATNDAKSLNSAPDFRFWHVSDMPTALANLRPGGRSRSAAGECNSCNGNTDRASGESRDIENSNRICDRQ